MVTVKLYFIRMRWSAETISRYRTGKGRRDLYKYLRLQTRVCVCAVYAPAHRCPIAPVAVNSDETLLLIDHRCRSAFNIVELPINTYNITSLRTRVDN